MKTKLLMRTIGSLVLVRQGRFEATDEEYEAALRVLSGARFDSLRMLVRTDGGGPSNAQRKRLSAVVQGRPVKVAVVTDSAKVRFIVSSIALFSREIRTFSTAEIEDAYHFLNLVPSERKSAETAMEEMGASIE